MVVTFIDALLSVALITFSIYAGIGLWRIRTNAVRTVKRYLYFFLGYQAISAILPFMAGLPSEANEAMIAEVIRGTISNLAYFTIWYLYLNRSERVKATYMGTLLPDQFPKNESDNLLFLYIKRKKLEEKNKIFALQASANHGSKEICSTYNITTTDNDKASEPHRENAKVEPAFKENNSTQSDQDYWYKSPYLIFGLPVVVLGLMFWPDRAYESLISTVAQAIVLAVIAGIYYGIKLMARDADTAVVGSDTLPSMPLEPLTPHNDQRLLSAVANGDLVLFLSLIEEDGVDVNATDSKGRTCLDVARARNDGEMFSLLRKHGGKSSAENNA